MDVGAGVVEVMVNSGSNPPVQHALLPDETRTVTVVMRFRSILRQHDPSCFNSCYAWNTLSVIFKSEGLV